MPGIFCAGSTPFANAPMPPMHTPFASPFSAPDTTMLQSSNLDTGAAAAAAAAQMVPPSQRAPNPPPPLGGASHLVVTSGGIGGASGIDRAPVGPFESVETGTVVGGNTRTVTTTAVGSQQQRPLKRAISNLEGDSNGSTSTVSHQLSWLHTGSGKGLVKELRRARACRQMPSAHCLPVHEYTWGGGIRSVPEGGRSTATEVCLLL